VINLDKIKIINTKDSTDYFEIPWEWLSADTYAPTLNDLEASGERGKLTGALSRVRCAEVPAASLEIAKMLTQKELYPLLKLLRKVEINIRYFEKYENAFVTKRFYAKKPNPAVHKIPGDNTTDDIIYDKFTIEFSGYEDINV